MERVLVLAHSMDLPESRKASKDGAGHTSKGRNQGLVDILEDDQNKQRSQTVDIVLPVRALAGRLLCVQKICHDGFRGRAT